MTKKKAKNKAKAKIAEAFRGVEKILMPMRIAAKEATKAKTCQAAMAIMAQKLCWAMQAYALLTCAQGLCKLLHQEPLVSS